MFARLYFILEMDLIQHIVKTCFKREMTEDETWHMVRMLLPSVARSKMTASLVSELYHDERKKNEAT